MLTKEDVGHEYRVIDERGRHLVKRIVVRHVCRFCGYATVTKSGAEKRPSFRLRFGGINRVEGYYITVTTQAMDRMSRELNSDVIHGTCITSELVL